MEFLLLLILLALCAILIAMPRQPPSSDGVFDALLAHERNRNPLPPVPAFGWPRMFFLTDSERAFLQREPWLFCTVLFVMLIAITVGGVYLRVRGLI